jgi:hypothetical protein
MIGLKRFIRPGLVVSAIGHLGFLMVGLLLVGANSLESTSPPPPDAMVVDVVPPNEVPRFSGTPSDLRSSGSQSSAQSNSPSATAQPPPQKKATTQPPQQPQQRPSSQRDASKASAQPSAAQPETARAEMVHAEKPEPEAKNQLSEHRAIEPPPPAPPQPEETPDQPGAAETLAELALAGGPLGGGFAAPPVDTTQAGYDFTAAFRERVSGCSTRPDGIDASDNVNIRLRVFLTRDGTLAAAPQMLDRNASSKQQALLQGITAALQRCQPYTMLPAEKYKQWKKLDLIVFPLNFLGQ